MLLKNRGCQNNTHRIRNPGDFLREGYTGVSDQDGSH